MRESSRLKSYWIVRRGTQWLLCAGGADSGILCSDKREDLVKVACRLGLERNADVCIVGEEQRIEACLSFAGGRAVVNGPCSQELVRELIRLGELPSNHVSVLTTA